MDRKRLAYLHEQYLNNTLSKDEMREWQAALADPTYEATIKHLMASSWNLPVSSEQNDWTSEQADYVFNRIIKPHQRHVRLFWFSAAAVIVITLMVGHLFQRNHPTSTISPSLSDIQPGTNRATLAIEGGRTIALSEAQAGIRIGEVITYLDGSLLSDISENVPRKTRFPESSQTTGIIPPQRLVLTTPRGGQYQVSLADGTKVWLNSASTLTYPSRFEGSERIVELDGEAYFEVQHESQQKRPFKVICRDQIVEVLGTTFNISTYADEPESKTTLVEGRVRILGPARATADLLPGQQAIVQDNRVQVGDADIQAATAWRIGRFNFDGKNLRQVMSELSRWYDIDVIYDGPIPEIRFFGGIHRNNRLSTVVSLLDANGIAYRLEADRKLVLSYPHKAFSNQSHN